LEQQRQQQCLLGGILEGEPIFNQNLGLNGLYLGCNRMSELLCPHSSNGIPTERPKAILAIDAVTGRLNEMH